MNLPYGYFENGFGYIRLEDIQLSKLPESIVVEGDRFVIKPEFHISLVWVGRLMELIDDEDKNKVKTEMISEFDKFSEEYSLKDFEIISELRLVKQGEQKSIIVRARVPNLDVFFTRLSQKYGVEFPVQPAHITLYTLPTDKIGIGILSQEELQEKSEAIDIPEIQSILSKA